MPSSQLYMDVKEYARRRREALGRIRDILRLPEPPPNELNEYGPLVSSEVTALGFCAVSLPPKLTPISTPASKPT
jgi:hypothetical protein